MIISKRLMNAAFHALTSELSADADFAAKSGMDSTEYSHYIREIQNIRAQLSCYKEHLIVSGADVLLPGEQA